MLSCVFSSLNTLSVRDEVDVQASSSRLLPNVHCFFTFAAPQVAFKEANAQAMPEDQFPSNTYDLYTIAFGIRNCTSVPDVLKEAYRVLKPGGTFACLEFSNVTNPLFRA